MKKRLSPTDILLLTISGILDFFQDIKDPGGLISNYYQNYYGFVPQRWKKRNIHEVIFYNSKKTKRIQKMKKGNTFHLQITKHGQNYLIKNFPTLIQKKTPWDGKWRLVIFDIEELTKHKRDYLRMKLQQFAFGMLQKSVWISPYKLPCQIIQEYIFKNSFEEKILILEVKFSQSEIEQVIIPKCWNLESINLRYKIFYQEFEILEKEIDNNQYSYSRNYKQFVNLLNNFYNLYQKDPQLPLTFLPKKWHYRELCKLITNIRGKIINKNKNINYRKH